MQFGANLWIWDSPIDLDVIARQAPVLRSWGFDLVELPYEAPGCWNPQAVRQILDENELSASVCVAMSADRDLTTTDARIVSQTQDYLKQAIAAANALGSRVVAGPIYAPTGRTGGLSRDERVNVLDRLGENLMPVLADARLAEVRLAVEPLNRFETSLFNTVAQTLELISLIADSRLGLLLDTFHMNIEEPDIPAAIRAAGSHLAHFHACGNDRGTPGNGSIPWSGIVQALRDISYDCAIVIESFVGTNDIIATAASIWRPLAQSQDAIAMDGLSFLLETFAGKVSGLMSP